MARFDNMVRLRNDNMIAPTPAAANDNEPGVSFTEEEIAAVRKR